MNELKINERFSDACPQLTKEELQKLEALILKDGVIFNPILIWNDVIVDGHNRYFIAKRNQIPFETKEITFASDEEAIIWIKENAISQRNLNNYQRSKLVLELEDHYKAKAKERMLAGKKTDPTPTLAGGEVRDQLASKAGVSHGTIDKVRFIEQKAKRETKRQLEKGEATINAVYHELQREEQWNERHPDDFKIRNQVEGIFEGLQKDTNSLFRAAVQKINYGYFDERIPEVALPGLAKKIKKRITEGKLTPNLIDMKNLIYQEHFKLDEYTIKLKALSKNLEGIENEMRHLATTLGTFNGALYGMKVQKMGLGGFNYLTLTSEITRLLQCLSCFTDYLGYKPDPPKPDNGSPKEPPKAIAKDVVATDVAFEETGDFERVNKDIVRCNHCGREYRFTEDEDCCCFHCICQSSPLKFEFSGSDEKPTSPDDAGSTISA